MRVITASVVVLAATFTAASAASTPPAAPSPPAASPAIVVFDQESFKGRSLSFDRAVPNLAAHQFDDRVASVTIQGSGDWVLCEHANYKGRCARVQAKAADLRLLQLNNRVSSLYPVPAAAAPATTPAP